MMVELLKLLYCFAMAYLHVGGVESAESGVQGRLTHSVPMCESRSWIFFAKPAWHAVAYWTYTAMA